jgi:hypothetical protein
MQLADDDRFGRIERVLVGTRVPDIDGVVFLEVRAQAGEDAVLMIFAYGVLPARSACAASRSRS